jgi:leader peptidase (prepilin peptidase)/N-methyltransferase
VSVAAIALFGGAAALAFGSFLGALAVRLPRASRWRDMFAPARSACPACGTTLGLRDLVPLLSYFWLRARCRHCGAKISADYALAEAGTLAAFWLAMAASAAPAFWLAFTLFAGFLLLIALIDRAHLFVPDEVLSVLALVWLVDTLLVRALPAPPLSGMIAASAAAALLAALRLAFQRLRGVDALGLGDVKLAAVLGLYIGWQNLGLFFALAALSTLAALALSRGRVERETRIPFAPGLCAAAAFLVLMLEAGRLPL